MAEPLRLKNCLKIDKVKRFVWAKKSPVAALTPEEQEESQATEEVSMAAQERADYYFGRYIEGDYELDHEMLGVRDDLAGVVEGIIDEGVNQTLREDKALQRPRATGWGRVARFIPGRGTYNAVRRLINPRFADDRQESVDATWGTGGTTMERRKDLAKRIFSVLTPAQKNTVETVLNIVVNTLDQSHIVCANPNDLEKLANQQFIRDIPEFRRLIELIRIHNKRIERTFSGVINMPTRLQGVLDGFNVDKANVAGNFARSLSPQQLILFQHVLSSVHSGTFPDLAAQLANVDFNGIQKIKDMLTSSDDIKRELVKRIIDRLPDDQSILKKAIENSMPSFQGSPEEALIAATQQQFESIKNSVKLFFDPADIQRLQNIRSANIDRAKNLIDRLPDDQSILKKAIEDSMPGFQGSPEEALISATQQQFESIKNSVQPSLDPAVIQQLQGVRSASIKARDRAKKLFMDLKLGYQTTLQRAIKDSLSDFIGPPEEALMAATQEQFESIKNSVKLFFDPASIQQLQGIRSASIDSAKTMIDRLPDQQSILKKAIEDSMPGFQGSPEEALISATQQQFESIKNSVQPLLDPAVIQQLQDIRSENIDRAKNLIDRLPDDQSILKKAIENSMPGFQGSPEEALIAATHQQFESIKNSVQPTLGPADIQRLQNIRDISDNTIDLSSFDKVIQLWERSSLLHVLNKTLHKEALFSLKPTENKALVAYLERVDRTEGVIKLHKRLNRIYDGQPPVEKGVAASEEEAAETAEQATRHQNVLKRIEELSGLYNILAEKYEEARSLGSNLDDLNKKIDRINKASDLDPEKKTDLLKELHRRQETANDKKDSIAKTVRDAENNYRKKAKDLLKLLNIYMQPLQDRTTNKHLARFYDSFRHEVSIDNSTTADLFSGSSNDFKTHIAAFSEEKLADLYPEEKQQTSVERQTLDPLQLLVRLKVEQLRDRGETNEERILEMATAQAFDDMLMADNVDFDWAVNRELAEGLGATTWQRIKKSLAARRGTGEVHTKESVIRGVTRRGSGLEIFKDLTTDITDKEIHILLSRSEDPDRDMTREAITNKFGLLIEALRNTVKGYRFDEDGKVELLDSDAVPLGQLVKRLEKIYKTRKVRDAKFRDMPAIPGVSKTQQAMEKLPELALAAKEEERGFVAGVKGVLRWISDKVWRKDVDTTLKDAMAKGFDKDKAMALLDEKHIAGAGGIVASAYAMRGLSKKFRGLGRGVGGGLAAAGGGLLGGAGKGLRWVGGKIWNTPGWGVRKVRGAGRWGWGKIKGIGRWFVSK